MRWFTSIFLLLVMTAFGTGLMQRLHMMEHEREDAASESQHPDPSKTPAEHHHSEDSCMVCAQFHAPMVSVPHTAWLIDAGLWVRFLSLLTAGQCLPGIPSTLSCRGPPVTA